MANRVTQDDIKNFNQLYYEVKNYAEVARRTGFSSSTIRKYVDKNFVPAKKFTPSNIQIPDEPLRLLIEAETWGPLIQLSEEEQEKIISLWAEI